jgi:hypothetical protein
MKKQCKNNAITMEKHANNEKPCITMKTMQEL